MADIAKQIREKAKQPKDTGHQAPGHSCPTCKGPVSKEQADAFAKGAGFANGGYVGEDGEPMFTDHGYQSPNEEAYDMNDDFLVFPDDENESEEHSSSMKSRLSRVLKRK